MAAAIVAGTAAVAELPRPDPPDPGPDPGLSINDAVARVDAMLEAGETAAAERLCADIGFECAPAVYAAGVLALHRRELNRAVSLLGSAALLAPRMAEFHLSHALALLQKQELEKCVEAARAALEIEPSVMAHGTLASAYSKLGLENEASEELTRLVELEPTNARAWTKLGTCKLRMDNLPEAISAFWKALELDPKLADAWLSIGRAFAQDGRLREAIEHMRKGRDLAPDNALINSAFLFALNEAPHVTADEVFGEHRRWGARLVELTGTGGAAFHENDPNPQRPLRVGFVSGDFRRHPVAFFIAPLLRFYDHRQFDFTCYFNGLHADPATWQIRSGVDHWADIAGRTDQEVADLIRHDGIDILIDLSGHTAGERLGIFALRPAPIQVTYLGYVSTTGLPTIDYIITDSWTNPPGKTEHLHTERIVRPFDSFVCYAPPTGSPDVSELPARKNGHITFGSFNRARKINPEVAALWSRVLKAIPGSRLLLKPGKSCEEPLRARFAEHGVEGRVDMSDANLIMRDYLASYADVDIALDCFPWNGLTTSCDALWMGVPILALEGTEHRSRMGVSLLQNVGLPELIARDEDEYVERAVALASDVDRLAEMRAGLRQRMQASPVMDQVGFTRAMEGAFREMWKTWCATRGARAPAGEGR